MHIGDGVAVQIPVQRVITEAENGVRCRLRRRKDVDVERRRDRAAPEVRRMDLDPTRLVCGEVRVRRRPGREPGCAVRAGRRR
jgi:hypothetical protein